MAGGCSTFAELPLDKATICGPRQLTKFAKSSDSALTPADSFAEAIPPLTYRDSGPAGSRYVTQPLRLRTTRLTLGP